MQRTHGRSLVELLGCLLIGTLTLTSALPAFTSTLQRNKQAQATNQLLGALHYARGAAVTGRVTTTLCSGLGPCAQEREWRDRLLIFTDLNENGQHDAGEELLQQLYIPSGFSWRWSNFRSRSYLQFEADGTTLALNGTFTLCDQNTPKQQVVINLTGRVRTQAAPANARCH
ncbi:GspH/FimT family pseudopilin [Pseudomonas benzenivorans]|uniref:Type II secretion system protein H n=1 Tax=Pseudomonas benzenivorans TaxID=556533 RepID=A0ABY5H5F9_9PSED|nr:GspH/FimT family pseudopilin [Pseudomonas benzenivorans]UTW06694.1 GspH/FimT family pseudopilin [Pseudomonas benzenivorans]